MTEDLRRHAPATDRNRAPIAGVLREVLPPRGTVLEIASGTGEHAAYFSGEFPDLVFQPTDQADALLKSIGAWRDHAGRENLLPPLRLDVTERPWPVTQADAIININMIHISPWAVTEELMAGAAAILPPGGVLYMYGPYRRDGRHTAPSNAAFHANLQVQSPTYGVRDLETVIEEAARNGLQFDRIVEMPANNLSVVYRRREA